MTYWSNNLSVVLGLGLLLPFLIAADTTPSADDYQVRESAANLELRTPWGKKNISGDFSPSAVGSYRFEIPISDLKPDAKAKDENGEVSKSFQDVRITNSYDPSGLEKLGKLRDSEPEKREPASTPTPGPTPPARLVIEYDDTDRLVLQANRLFNLGKYFDASLVVDELVRKRPEFVRGWVMKGSLLKVQGYNDLALKAWERALVLEPGNKEIRGLAGTMTK